MTVKDFFLSLDKNAFARRYAEDNLIPYTLSPGNAGISQEEALHRLTQAALTFLEEVAGIVPAEDAGRIVYVPQPEADELEDADDEDGCWLTPLAAESAEEPMEEAAILSVRHWPEALGYQLGNTLPDACAQAAAIAVYLRYPGFQAC